MVALSKLAFLTSALAVNQHIDAASKDIWINPLPHFHVGGLSIYARAHLSKSYVYRYDRKWNSETWTEFVQAKRGTLTSLTPTQLFDLVEKQHKVPTRLRVLFVGGGPLHEGLYEQAKALGWPIMPTYGMTEMCSQIATADLKSSRLKLLPHVEAKRSSEGRLLVKSKALFTGYYEPDFIDPKIDGWFETEDLVDLEGEYLIPRGRGSDILKIKGELVNLFHLEEVLESLKAKLQCKMETAVIPKVDARAGYKLYLYHTLRDVAPLLEAFNKSVIPEAKITEAVFVPALPKNSLGKVIKTLE